MTTIVPKRAISRALARWTVAAIVVWLCLTDVVSAATFFSRDPDPSQRAPLLDAGELEALASPIALYPDELLAIVLPASTYPLQIVQAARFIESRESDPNLEPDDAWDETVVALLNYPEALALLNSDLEWTADLGLAVLNQEEALVRAITMFRERAYATGNLRSDEHIQVRKNAEVIEVTSAAADALYVPYYDPRDVIVPQASPAYHYYTTRYPLYYYPYTSRHRLFSNPFWGLTTAYAIGWGSRRIHYHRHHYRSHPYHDKHYERDHYRSHDFRDPRHQLHAGPTHYRTYRGDDWGLQRHRFDRRRGFSSNRYERGYPSRFAHRGHPSDRIRSGFRRHDDAGRHNGGDRHRPTHGDSRQAAGVRKPAHGVARERGKNGVTRANNGALGNGNTTARRSPPRAGNGALGNGNRARANPARPLTRPDAVVAKIGTVAGSRAPARGRSPAAGANRQTRATGGAVRRANARVSKPSSRVTTRAKGANNERTAAGNRTIAGSNSPGRQARSSPLGISSSAIAASNPRSIGNAYRGNGGNRGARPGSAFRGNGGSRSRR